MVRAAPSPGEFVPAGNPDRLRALHQRIADLNRARLTRARAEGRSTFGLLGTDQVYRHPDDDGRPVSHEELTGEQLSRAELAGFVVTERPKHVERYDRAILDGRRRSRVQLRRVNTPATVTGRAPRMSTNGRRRGSRRTGSGSRAGPDDDPDLPSKPPLGLRLWRHRVAPLETRLGRVNAPLAALLREVRP